MGDLIPKVSIVTITRNNAEGLRATLQSVAELIDAAFELIVIDGNSSDNTDQVLQDYSGLISHFEHDAGQGIYAAMNQGVRLAHGEWIIFMNAGDCFAHRNVLKQFDPAEGSDLVFGGARKTDGTPQLPYEGLAQIWKNLPFSHQSLFCRAKILHEYPFDTSFRIAGDFDFVLQAFSANKHFERIDVEVAIADGDGISNTQYVLRVTECYRAARRYHFWNLKMHFHYYKKLRWARWMDANQA